MTLHIVPVGVYVSIQLPVDPLDLPTSPDTVTRLIYRRCRILRVWLINYPLDFMMNINTWPGHIFQSGDSAHSSTPSKRFTVRVGCVLGS